MKNSPDTQSREQKLRQQLILIGGTEEAIRMAMEDRDYELIKQLKTQKQKYYAEARKLAYGL